MNSLQCFDAARLRDSYGISGEETGKKIQEAVQKCDGKLELAYTKRSKQFVVINSSAVTAKQLRAIFDQQGYHKWQPHIEPKRNGQGNVVVTLQKV